MKKYFVWFLVLILLVSCAACAAQDPPVEEQPPVSVAEFIFTEESGYGFTSVPLGSSLQEVSDALNCTLVSKAESLGGTHDETNDVYWTQEIDAVEVLGKKARVEVAFDGGKLYDLSFILPAGPTEKVEAFYHETAEAFKNAFGEPMTEAEEENSASMLWQHENNTQLLISIQIQDESALLQVGVADITVLLND